MLGETTYDSHFTAPGVTFTASSGDAGIISAIESLLAVESGNSANVRRRVMDDLTDIDDDSVARHVLAVYSKLEDDLKPAAVELLTSRVSWAR